MPDINGIPYVESTDLVSAYPAASQALAQEISDQLASKLPYSYGTATPSTTDSGFLWYDSNSTPPVPKYWNGSSFATLAPAPGLELIATESYSSTSALNVNGCFSATYRNYFVMLRHTQTDATQARLRLRASGADSTTSIYERQLIAVTGSTITGSRIQETSYELGFTSAGGHLFVTMFISDPAEAVETHFMDFSLGADSTISMRNYYLRHTAATAYDGFTLYPGAGTMTGTIRVYGYKD